MTAHPYMANSTPELEQRAARRDRRRRRRGAVRADPRPRTACRATLELPPALASEARCGATSLDLLARNETCERNLSFLGGGMLAAPRARRSATRSSRRSEFLTPVWGTPSSDHGRNQAWFEFASQLGELLGMDFVGLPVYSWGCAAGHAIRMAARLTGRREVLVPGTIDPERLAVIRTYCEPPRDGRATSRSTLVDHDPATGRLDLDDLEREALGAHRRRLLREPLLPRRDRGRAPPRSRALAHAARRRDDRRRRPDLARRARAARPTTAPTSSSARTQPLGVHMNCGGGVGGFIASRDEERYAREYPTLTSQHLPTRSSRASAASAIALFAADLVRHARGGQRLDRQLGLPLGDRERRLHVAARAARASRSSAS